VLKEAEGREDGDAEEAADEAAKEERLGRREVL